MPERASKSPLALNILSISRLTESPTFNLEIVSNDFFERDYLYINNQDGTFSEELTNAISSISAASMGADMADIDNDGSADIFVTEMLPSEYERLKSVTTFENWDKYKYNVDNGYIDW